MCLQFIVAPLAAGCWGISAAIPGLCMEKAPLRHPARFTRQAGGRDEAAEMPTARCLLGIIPRCGCTPQPHSSIKSQSGCNVPIRASKASRYVSK